MKKVRKIVYCSRCGDEISAEELALVPGTTCALCSHMQYEAREIRQSKHKAVPSALPLHTVAVNSR
jgi:RNA polymerase-binding transcription factor DksA